MVEFKVDRGILPYGKLKPSMRLEFFITTGYNQTVESCVHHQEKNMKKLAFVILITLSSGAFAESASLKAGLWEIKPISHVVDGRDMTAQMAAAQVKMQQAMASMTPEQRKQMEAMMKGTGANSASAGSLARICISPAMSAKNTPMVDHEGRCAPAKVTRNGNKSTFEFNCTANGRTMVGSGESTTNGDRISTSVNMTTTDSKGHHTMQSESEMTYLGSNCQGIKPADQLAKDFQNPSQQK